MSTASDRADMQEAVRLVCGCGCPKCVRVVSTLAENDLPWPGLKSPCHVGAGRKAAAS